VVASVVAVLYPRQPLKPAVRTVTGKATQIHLDSAIDNLGLTITLGMISCTKSQFGSTQAKQFSPKQTGECDVTITHNSFRQTIKFENIVKEQTSKLHPVFHVSCLKPFHSTSVSIEPSLPVLTQGELQPLPKAILDSRFIHNTHQVLVH
jgi:hypothetical protein